MDLGKNAGQNGCCLEAAAVISVLVGLAMYFTRAFNELCIRIDHDEIDELVYGDLADEGDG